MLVTFQHMILRFEKIEQTQAIVSSTVYVSVQSLETGKEKRNIATATIQLRR